MRFLVDECLHHSVVAVAQERGFEASHVNWLGLSGTSDWDLMPHILQNDYTFLTHNARDFRKLYGKEELHAGLVIIIPQLVPRDQCALFAAILDQGVLIDGLVNEVVEVSIDGEEFVVTRYELPEG